MRPISTYDDMQIIRMIGERYRMKRIQQKKNQMFLVETLGISRPTISHFETGSCGTSLLLFISLMRIVDQKFLKKLIAKNDIDSLNDEQILKILGRKCQFYRKGIRKTQEEIAEMILVSMPTISRFENGKVISLFVFVKLLRAVEKIDLFDNFLSE